MALGGGTFTTQNKVLPGAYLNFVSAARASATLSDRGVAAMPLELDWGPDGEVFTVTAEQFQKQTRELFGYAYTHERMKGLRELFSSCKTCYFYKVNTGVKAQNDFAQARYSGKRGNDFQVVITADGSAFAVTLLLDGAELETQTVANAGALKDNAYVIWKKDAALAESAGVPLTGGTNGDAADEAYQAFLDKIEPYSFNTLGCLSTKAAVKDLFVQFTKRMRDDCGVKFQTVLYRPDKPDYEGIIGVENNTLDAGWPESAAVYWVTGAEAGCAVNRSCTNMTYSGAFTILTPHTQAQLADQLEAGKFVFHKVGDEVRVLEDINTFVSITDEKGEDFGANQTVRVIDQIGNDIAALFNNKYLGRIPNDNAGRISLWNDIVSHHKQLESIRAIEGFSSDAVQVTQGDSKKAVVVSDVITPTNAMAQLYMTLMIS